MALLLGQNVDTSWNSTYHMLKTIKNLKSSVRYNGASYENDQDSIITTG